MKVSEVSMTAGDSEILCFSLSAPRDNDRFYVRTMIGMDATDIVSRFNRFGLYSGQPLVTQSIVDRDIVLRVVLNPEWQLREDYSTLRDDIYRGISKSRTGRVKLSFLETGLSIAEIEGVITKVEVPLFSNTPELQITINCPDAMLVAPNPQEVSTALFTQESSTTPFVGNVIDTQSTAPHGFLLTATLTAFANKFFIRDNDAASVSAEWKFEIDYSFLSGDVLSIDTRTRDRAVYITRGAQRIDLMTNVSLDSIWPSIYPGRNPLAIAFEQSPTQPLLDLLTFSHHATYWGI